MLTGFSVRAVYLGAGIRAWTAMRKMSMMKEQTRLVVKDSSLICENWNTKNKCYLHIKIRVFIIYSCIMMIIGVLYCLF